MSACVIGIYSCALSTGLRVKRDAKHVTTGNSSRCFVCSKRNYISREISAARLLFRRSCAISQWTTACSDIGHGGIHTSVIRAGYVSSLFYRIRAVFVPAISRTQDYDVTNVCLRCSQIRRRCDLSTSGLEVRGNPGTSQSQRYPHLLVVVNCTRHTPHCSEGLYSKKSKVCARAKLPFCQLSHGPKLLIATLRNDHRTENMCWILLAL